MPVLSTVGPINCGLLRRLLKRPINIKTSNCALQFIFKHKWIKCLLYDKIKLNIKFMKCRLPFSYFMEFIIDTFSPYKPINSIHFPFFSGFLWNIVYSDIWKAWKVRPHFEIPGIRAFYDHCFKNHNFKIDNYLQS